MKTKKDWHTWGWMAVPLLGVLGMLVLLFSNRGGRLIGFGLLGAGVILALYLDHTKRRRKKVKKATGRR